MHMNNEITTGELEKLLIENPDIQIVDVREKNEWDMIRIPGAKLIPVSSIQFRVEEIDFSAPVYLLCRSWGRSGRIAEWLKEEWKNAINIQGGIKELYQNKSKTIEITDIFSSTYFL